ncbi:sn-glycerol 3-phosphate transport system substrate-binding protein [Paenibacillus sp. 1_12]|uniref:ABC transporter substrate-binding protein n=1 Tax=Paenibacillus sp. 1_12 TaxID=1566278 RepID=UPI0008EC3C1A|nr:ABC transporter substrate-binding protein [Paenibacillus sp. 1_12]SFK96477.1 sn-glycerol 3-phosphate transport system substrate-binding protein [Paenibacillus sp. 1_12]
MYSRKSFAHWKAALASLVLISTVGCGVAAPASTTGSSAEKKTESQVAKGIELGKNGPITIDFWHIQATIYGDAIKEMVAAFNKEYEGKIIVKEVFQGSYDDLNKKVRAALQGGGLPAVAMSYESDTLEYMKADKIVALDDYINDPVNGLNKQALDDIMPGVLSRQRIPEYNGKTMSWPHGNSSMGVYYNIDLLKKAGYDKPAATWQEFEKMALDITQKSGEPALVMSNANNGGTFRTWLRTYGIDPIKLDQSGVNYDNPQAVELASMMKNLLDKKAIMLAENTEQEFTNGRAAMEIGTTARTSSKLDLIKDKFKWGITLIPQGKSGGKVTELYGGNQVLFKTTPEKQLAGWLFLKYFAESKAQAIYAAKTGYFPATKSAQETDLLKKNYAENPQKKQAFDEVFPYALIDVSSAARSKMDTVVGEALQAMNAGKLTPADALKKAQVDATKALKEFK